VLLRFRLSILIAVTAVAVLVGARLYAWPVYRPPGQGSEVKPAWSEAPVNAAGARGWTWAGGTPGFQLGHDEAGWNFSLLKADELAPARAAAARQGVDPDSLRILQASRTGPHDLALLVAGTDGSGRTCVGAGVPRRPLEFTCPPHLGRQVAFVSADAMPTYESGQYPVSLLGAVRGDVTRVEVSAPGYVQTVYRRQGNPTWGTFSANYGASYFRMRGPWASTLETVSAPAPSHPWQARLAFYGKRGLIAGAALLFDRESEQLVTVEGAQGAAAKSP
jgi:hypothetical protein